MPGPQHFPTGAAYSEAIQNPSVCFIDPDLHDGKPQLDKLGQPKPISGNFASVFCLTSSGGRRFAVKCFTHDVADQRVRYEAISRHLDTVDGAGLSQPWKMDFTYLPDGILVGRHRWPVLKMAWVDGSGLLTWLQTHRHDTVAVWKLAERFAALVADLERLRIGHGDLQHGNLLVAADGSLRLVDYDGMFVPSLSSSRAVEDGHRHYQPPTRGAGDFGEAIDRFSAWIIYMSLVALATDPTLWDRLRTVDDEFLLTADEDYKAPWSSWRLEQLAAVGGETTRLVTMVRELSGKPLAAMPSLVPVATRPTATAVPLSAALGTPKGSRPAWLDDHLAAIPVKAETPTGFERRRRWDLAAVLAWLVVGAAGVVSSVLMPAISTLAIALAVAGMLIPDMTRRSRAEWKLAQEVRATRRRQLDQLGDPAADLKKAEQDHHKQIQGLTKQLDTLIRRQQELAARRTRDLGQADRKLAGHISDVERRIRQIDDNRAYKASRELEQLRAEHVTQHLRRMTIDRAAQGIQGVGPAAVRALASYGIRSAADLNIQLAPGSSAHNTRIAVFVLPNGRQTRIEGIGEGRAKALLEWRDRMAAQAARTAPSSLSALRLNQLRSESAAETTRLKAEQSSAENQVRLEKEAINKTASMNDAQLVVERQKLSSQRAAAEAAHQATTAALRDAAREQDQVARALAAERQARRALGLLRYLRFAMFGS
jgi:hypothetical protein